MENQAHIMWVNRASQPRTFGEAVAETTRYLQLLATLHADFGHWQITTNQGFKPVAADLSDLKDSLRAAARPGKNQRQEYTHLDAGFNLTDASAARFGFMFSLATSVAGYQGGAEWARPDHAEFRVTFGADADHIVLQLPAGRPDLVAHDHARRLLTASIDCWGGDHAQCFAPAFAARLEEGHQGRIGILRAVWMCYLRQPLLAACLRPGLPCEVERLGEDGLLFTLGRSSPDPGNPQDLARARALQAIFDGFHFDHAVALYGWPNDPDEPRYTTQVTGAPAGRAYAVGFCAFDGYDAERRVLLFARLFRLPPQWGTNLLPYYRENRERLEGLPYVVQARQHIAAVRYAGAETPVEWHVGVADTAAALHTLLNDWAAIPVEQLRVVHTPFEGLLDKEAPCL